MPKLTPEELVSLHKVVDTWANSLEVPPIIVVPPMILGSQPPVLEGVDTSRWKLTLADPFTGPLWGNWDSIFNHSDITENGCTLLENGELQWYPNWRIGFKGSPPWITGPEGLVLRASVNIDPNLGYDRPAKDGQPALRTKGTHKYVSGLLSNHATFGQTYGYFQIRACLPDGRGMWPAFWLKGLQWPPEIDILEVPGPDRHDLYTTLHLPPDNRISGIKAWVNTLIWHDYGLLWEPTKLTLFIDGKKAGGGVIPGSIHTPMHILLDLAVGGNWAGYPDANIFPAEAKFKDLQAWQF